MSINLPARLNYYGFDLLYVPDSTPSNRRKRRKLAVKDRRTGYYMCVYPTEEQIETWLISMIPGSEFLEEV